MFVHTLKSHQFTIFYFDCHGSYQDLLSAIEQYIDAGPTEKELFYFDKDAQMITPDEVRNIINVASRATKKRNPGGKTALLYGRISLYGLGKIYKVVEGRIIDKNWHTEVFKDVEDALTWLAIPTKVVTETIEKFNRNGAQKPFLYSVTP
jgi:hypothetical protein